jgi:hypothetical protein
VVRSSRYTAPVLALVALAGGCVSQSDLDQAMRDQVRFQGRVMGFALDAQQETLASEAALLKAFEGDPKLPLLEAKLGSAADVEAKLERVRTERRSLIEESQRLQARYGESQDQ